jgi:hypothetical protein
MASLKTTVSKPVYTLTLSEEELKTLQLVLQKVGGCPLTSPRKYADTIYDAIYTEPTPEYIDTGSITFKSSHMSLIEGDDSDGTE